MIYNKDMKNTLKKYLRKCWSVFLVVCCLLGAGCAQKNPFAEFEGKTEEEAREILRGKNVKELVSMIRYAEETGEQEPMNLAWALHEKRFDIPESEWLKLFDKYKKNTVTGSVVLETMAFAFADPGFVEKYRKEDSLPEGIRNELLLYGKLYDSALAQEIYTEENLSAETAMEKLLSSNAYYAFQLSENLLYYETLTGSQMRAVLSGIRTYYTANKDSKYDHEVIAEKLFGWYRKREDPKEKTGIAEVLGICDDEATVRQLMADPAYFTQEDLRAFVRSFRTGNLYKRMEAWKDPVYDDIREWIASLSE